MNVYDFDETIYDGDCTRDFIFYCLKKYPKTCASIPGVLVAGVRFLTNSYTKTQFKEKVYCMLKYLPDVEYVLEEFVSANVHKIKPWYLEQQKTDDLIISASPEFLIGSFCKEIGIYHYMASRVNQHTGVTTGENCYGEEKVKRYKEKYDVEEMDQFYSDSLSDTPLALLAKEAFLVKGNRIKKW